MQIILHHEVQRLIERGVLWFLRNGGSPLNNGDAVGRFAPTDRRAGASDRDDVAGTGTAGRVSQRVQRWQADGVPEELARHIARLIVLPSACDIVRASEECGVDAAAAGRLYFAVGEQLGFDWLRERAEALVPPDIGSGWRFGPRSKSCTCINGR